MEDLEIVLELPEVEESKNEEKPLHETVIQESDEEISQEEISKEDAEEEIDIVQAKYEIFKQYGAVRETDIAKVTEEYLEEELSSLPERAFMEYVQSLPDYIQNTLIYAANKENLSQEEFVKFVSQMVAPSQVDVSTNENARNYLKNNATFRSLYDTDDEIEEALDMLEDKNILISKAEKLISKDTENKTTLQKQAIEDAKAEKQRRLEEEKRFAEQIENEAKTLAWEKKRIDTAKSNINQNFINEKYQQIVKNPKGLLQFVDLLSHVENGNLDNLYKVLEGKTQSNTAKTILGNIEKDSLSKALSKNRNDSSRPAVDILSISEA